MAYISKNMTNIVVTFDAEDSLPSSSSDQAATSTSHLNIYRLNIRHIDASVTAPDLWRLFSKVGPIDNVCIVIEGDRRPSEGKRGYVVMMNDCDVALAYANFQNYNLKGSPLQLDYPDVLRMCGHRAPLVRARRRLTFQTKTPNQ